MPHQHPETSIPAEIARDSELGSGGGGSGGPRVRNTVVQASVSALGLPNFLTSAGRDVTLGASVGSPVLVTAAQGFNASGPVDVWANLTANLLWDELPLSSTQYLYLNFDAENDVTVGNVAVRPRYGRVRPAGTVGLHFFDTVKKKMQVCTNVTTGGTAPTNVALGQTGRTFPTNTGTDSNAAQPVANVLDADMATYWESAASTGLFDSVGIGVTWATPVTVHTFKIRQHATVFNNKVAGVILYYTVDGTTWTKDTSGTYNFTGTYGPNGGYGEQVVPIRTPVANCRGIALKAAGNTGGGSGNPWRVFDLQAIADVETGGSTETWEDTTRVFVGEAVLDGTGITSLKTYAINGEAILPRHAVAASSTITEAHNLGTEQAIAQVTLASVADGALTQVLVKNLDRLNLSYDTPAGTVESVVSVVRAF